MSDDTETPPEMDIRIVFEKYAHRALDVMKGKLIITTRPPDGIPVQTQESDILDFIMSPKHNKSSVTWTFEVTIP